MLDFLYEYISLDFLPDVVAKALSDSIPDFLVDFICLIVTVLVDIYGAIMSIILEIPDLMVCFSPLLLLWIPAFILARKRFSWVFFWVGVGANICTMVLKTINTFQTASDISVSIIFYWILFYALVMFLGGSIANRSEKYQATHLINK